MVDNASFGKHGEALEWLARNFSGTLNVATGYIGLNGLETLARIATGRDGGGRLLIGAAPSSESLTGPAEIITDRFEKSVEMLLRERNLSAFPAVRRAVLERITNFIKSDDVEVRRYLRRFLHGKAYIIGSGDGAGLSGPGAALVSSANLTAGGLCTNLELGMVHYQPNVVDMALSWYGRLWDEAQDYKDELLDLLLPPSLESDPQTVFLRALLEIYEDFDDVSPLEPHEHHTLTAFQRDGLARAKRILGRYGGALYADGVGMGKTEIGIEMIREYTQVLGHHVLVISPAQLRDNLWERRLHKENLPGKVISYQELARDRQLSRDSDKAVLPVDKDVYRLVVVDEAHAYRSANNTWYAALDRLMGGTPKKLLLLTATPVNNSLWDLHNLFLLFARHDGAFADRPLRIPSLQKFFVEVGASDVEYLSETRLFPIIDALTIRRDRAFVAQRYAGEFLSDGTEVKFPKPELHECRYDLDGAHPRIVQDIAAWIDRLTMARYHQSSYMLDREEESRSETALAGLIKSQMLKRFESSWYAALKTVKRMRGANVALAHAIERTDVVPPPEVIRDIAGDGDDVSLSGDVIDRALEDMGSGTPVESFDEYFLPDVRKDIEILTSMAGRLERLEGRSDPKLETLRRIMSDTPSKKVAIFTAFRDTAEYLEERIRENPGILGERRLIVVAGTDTGAEARVEAMERFCPESADVRPGFRPAEEVDVLLSTDVLSEGQNMQQAQAVLSFDMPWNPQRVVQRNGRVIRLRSPHDKVYLYTLLPMQGDLDRLLRLEARIQAKVMAANASVGMETPVLAHLEPESRIYNDLSRFTERLSGGDTTLLDEREAGGSAFAGEVFRSHLMRAASEGEVGRLRGLPWGIGAAFAHASSGMTEPAVFFACRTRSDDRYWRLVSRSGKILLREDLPILRAIDPQNRPGVPMPNDLDLESLFDVAAADICTKHNSLAEIRSVPLPASQRWALGILRMPDAPAGKEYDNGDRALSVGRNVLVRRELSRLRREYENGLDLYECAGKIIHVVKKFGLVPMETRKIPERINKDDVGVVCYQVVLPPGSSANTGGGSGISNPSISDQRARQTAERL